MNWDDLRLFLAVARAGSISAGARRLGLQHSTVSRRMHKLEEDLGVRLLEKTRDGCDPTLAGQNLLQAATRMEREAVAVEGGLAGLDQQLVGPLRVTAINNMATTVLMPMFRDFMARYPGVELHVMVSNEDASLAGREADVAIRLANAPTDTLVGKRVVTVASTIYASPDYRARLQADGGTPQWLGVACCGFHRSWTRAACEGQRHRFYSDDTLLTQAALCAGLGISILPCFLGDADPGLVRWCEPRPEWSLGLWILLHPDLRRTARVLAFRSHMVAAIEARRAIFEGHP